MVENPNLNKENLSQGKYGKVIWQQNTFTNKFEFIFRTILYSFMLFLIPLFLFIALAVSSLMLFLLSIVILVIAGIALSSILLSKTIYSIKFTESFLLIKRRALGLTKKFEIPNLLRIEIALLKESEWLKARHGRGRYAKVKFAFKVITNENREKNYTFVRRLFSPRQGSYDDTMQKAVEIKGVFEEEFDELANLFPKLIKTVDLPPKIQKKTMDILLRLIVLAFMLIFFYYFVLMGTDYMHSSRFLFPFILLIVVICASPIVYLIKKLKEKRDKNKV